MFYCESSVRNHSVFAGDCLLLVFADVSWQLDYDSFVCVLCVISTPFSTTLRASVITCPIHLLLPLLRQKSITNPCRGYLFVLLRPFFLPFPLLAQPLRVLATTLLFFSSISSSFSAQTFQNFSCDQVVIIFFTSSGHVSFKFIFL